MSTTSLVRPTLTYRSPPSRPQSRPNGTSLSKAERGGQQNVKSPGGTTAHKDHDKVQVDRAQQANASELGPQRIKSDVVKSVNSIYQYPPAVVKVFGNQISKLPDVSGIFLVSNFTLLDWQELKRWFEETDDLNQLEFEYSQEKQELTAMSYTEQHHRLQFACKYVRGQVWKLLPVQPPQWLSNVIYLETDPLEYITLRVSRSKKVPDVVGGFNIGSLSIKTSFTEVAKSQGLHTSTSTTNQTVNKEGALNKTLAFIDNFLKNAQGKKTGLIDVDVLNAEEVLEDRATWGYTGGTDHAYRVEELEYDKAAFSRLKAAQNDSAKDGLIPGAGPFTAPTHLQGDRKRTVFGGATRLYWIHIPVDDATAVEKLRQSIANRESMEWWLATDYAIRVLDEYVAPDEKKKVDEFLNMVWSDFCKRLALIASLLLREQTVQDIATKLLEQDISDDDADRRLAELVKYAHALLKPEVVRQQPQPFIDFISTLVHHCKQGAYGTAANRLIDHSTVAGQEAHPDLSFEGEKLFNIGDDQTVLQDYGANFRQRMLQAVQKRKREEDAGGPVGDVDGPRRRSAPGASREERRREERREADVPSA